MQVGEGGQGAAEEWRKRGMASRSEAYQEKGTVREKGWVTAANGYRPKDSERDKEIQSWCKTKKNGEKARRKDKERCGQGGRQRQSRTENRERD